MNWHFRAGDQSIRLKVGFLVRRHPVGLALALALVVMAVPLYGILEQQKEIQDATRRNCRRANVQNAYVRLRVAQDPLPPHIFPILNCVAALNGSQRGVPLPIEEQRKYMDAIAHGRLPIVDGEHVVDSEPYPPGGPSGRQIDRTEG